MDGLYAVFFLISTLISSENPIANGFIQTETEAYNKISFAKVEFQNQFIGIIAIPLQHDLLGPY